MMPSVTRIPDFVGDAIRIAYEVKFVGEFRVTQQIIDTAILARDKGYSYVLLLWEGSAISQATRDTLSQLGVGLQRFQ